MTNVNRNQYHIAWWMIVLFELNCNIWILYNCSYISNSSLDHARSLIATIQYHYTTAACARYCLWILAEDLHVGLIVLSLSWYQKCSTGNEQMICDAIKQNESEEKNTLSIHVHCMPQLQSISHWTAPPPQPQPPIKVKHAVPEIWPF